MFRMNLIILLLIVGLVGCPGFGVTYKDPSMGVDVICETEGESSSCHYIGPDGKEVGISAPTIKKDEVK